MVRGWLVAAALVLATGPASAAQQAPSAPQAARPALAVPPPTAAELALLPRAKALPLDLAETKTAMGWGKMPYMAVGAPDHVSAIVDSGFKGLKDWLAGHPREAPQTTYVNPPEGAAADEGEHGFTVYRVARLVQANAKILLYRVKGAGAMTLLRAIDDAARKGAMVINVSLGIDSLFEIVEQDTAFVDALHRLLMRREVFVLFAAGNERQQSHAWISSDADGNGYVDAFPPAPARTLTDAFRVVMQPGTSDVYFSWDWRRHPGADYELEVTTRDGRRLAGARADPNGKSRGFIALSHQVSQRTPALLRVRRLNGPAGGVFMRLRAADIAVAADFNGLQSMNTYGLRENPFLVFVGGMGKTGTGTLAPSAFSNIGTRPDGTLFPHILGPGQLVIDGKEIRGTSIASPFVAAIYGLSTGFNIKNVMARTSSHALLDPSVAPHERSRWGVPVAFKAVFTLRDATGPTRIEGVTHRVEGDHLVIGFSVTRCCMEGMTWWVSANLFDAQANTLLINAETKKAAGGHVELRSDKADYVRHRAELRIPLKGLEAARGKTVGVAFGITVHAWRAAPRSYFKIDEAPAYRLTL